MNKIGVAGAAVAVVAILIGGRYTANVQVQEPELPAPRQPVKPVAAVITEPTTTSVPVTAPMQEALLQVAAAYEITSQFPPYSIPLSEQQTELLQPNAGAVTQRDLTPLGLPGSLTVQLSAFRYKVGDSIKADITLSGDDALFTQLGSLRLTLENDDGEVLQRLQSSPAQNPNEYRWQAEFEAREDWAGMLNVVADMRLTDGAELQQRAPLQVFNAVAEVTGIGTTRISNNELIIPVEIRDAESGFYKLAATLHRADQSPLGYLQGQAKIGSSGTIDLKAHGMLLHALGNTQPLLIGNIQLRKIPERPQPGVDIEWGFSREDFYQTDDIDPSRFVAEPFQDEQTAMRLQFLQSLANPGT
ncbi:hypothetical protein GJQ54_11920 [Oceanospirillaceae bacterium ASx5O]|nr:hypothetical protein GJQ54_11920 [Oceanospirillaceae bacterium ASx5O]